MLSMKQVFACSAYIVVVLNPLMSRKELNMANMKICLSEAFTNLVMLSMFWF